jgi:hypothetical protein
MGKFINLNNDIMNDFIDSITSEDDIMYAWVGGPFSWPDETNPPDENLSVKDSDLDLRNNMLFGKRISNTDVALLINKNVWESEKYAMYDHRDDKLFDKKFFVINNANNVYKCLNNNRNSVSTIEPIFISNTAIELADGYVWKYMYSLSTDAALKFATDKEIPIVANSDVTAAAVHGSLEVITVEEPGSNYITINNGTIQQIISPTLIKIDDTALSANNFYTKSAFYVSSGVGAGSIAEITSYYANNIGKYVVLNSPITVDLSSTYIISPKVIIEGDGLDAKAYCVVNPETFEIDKIKMVDTGEKYTLAEVRLQANNIHGYGAVLSPILSPAGGHGSNVAKELGNEKMVISMSFSGDEEFTLPINITVRQMGLIRNPNQLSSNTVIRYEEPKFVQLVKMQQVLFGVVPFNSEEIIKGQLSSARGRVVAANTTHTSVTMLNGTFIETETVIGQNSGISGQIFNITNRNLDKYSGDIIFYDNLHPIQRTASSNETLKIVVKF